MDRQRWQQVEGLLKEALERDEDERQALVAMRSQGDSELRREVESLLAAHARAGSFSDLPTLRKTLEDARSLDPGGELFGPYTVLGKLGEGGMSTVFLAERSDEEYRRLVAIKVLKTHLRTAALCERFRTERQILADLEHPNIAGMYEGGTTSRGVPYLVMEYVEGLPIDEHCDRHRLALEERIALFRQVCSAVAFAHRSLVVHRDIKPGNILVTRDGNPKLLDFGIAKLLAGEDTHLTRTGQQVFTPSYASPEQLRDQRITTASDVYSLGILLYLLLTGRLPHRRTLSSRLEEILDQRAPTRPSLAVLRAAEHDAATSPEQAAQDRSSEPGRLSRRLEGDLDAIALKALRISPERRYPSVEELASDLDRLGAGLPVEARRQTLGYRARKFVRRHRLGVGLAAGLLLSLGATAWVATAMAARIGDQRDQMQLQRDKERQVSAYLVEMFEVSKSGEPGERVEARKLLDLAARRIEAESTDDPDLQASLFDTLGSAYARLGLAEDAEDLIRRGLALREELHGAGDVMVATSLHNLAWILHGKGRWDEAELLVERALAIQEQTLGTEHPARADNLLLLAKVLREAGELERAERSLRQGLEILAGYGPASREIADLSSELGLLRIQRGDLEGAEAPLRLAAETHRKTLGDTHPALADTLIKLAILHHERGKFADEEHYTREALEIHRRLFPEPHPKIAYSLQHLARSLYAQGKLDESEATHREALAMGRLLYEEPHPFLCDALNDLGLLLFQKGELDPAAEMLTAALEMRRAQMGGRHPRVVLGHYNLAGLLHAKGDLAAADASYRRALAHLDLFGDAPPVAFTKAGYSELLIDLGDFARAEELLAEAETLLAATLPPDHWRRAWVASLIASCRAGRGRHTEALSDLERSVADLRAKVPQDRLRILRPSRFLAAAYSALGRETAAAEMEDLIRRLEAPAS